MVNEPKDVTSCNFIKLDGVIRDVEQYALSSDNFQLQRMNNAFGHPVLILVAGTGCKAKPFGIPIRMNMWQQDHFVVDARQVTAISSLTGFKPTSIPDFRLTGMLALFSSIWASPDKGLLATPAMDLSPIYGTWLASTLSAAFNLQPDQRTEVSIIASYFYLNQVGEKEDSYKVAGRIAKDLKLEFDRVTTVIENIGNPIENLEDFINCLKNSSAGIRLDKLDVATLYQVSCGVWMGPQGRSIMEVALEFPPYIVALAEAALLDKSYRRCRFFEFVTIFNRRREIEGLPQALEYLRKGLT